MIAVEHGTSSNTEMASNATEQKYKDRFLGSQSGQRILITSRFHVFTSWQPLKAVQHLYMSISRVFFFVFLFFSEKIKMKIIFKRKVKT